MYVFKVQYNNGGNKSIKHCNSISVFNIVLKVFFKYFQYYALSGVSNIHYILLFSIYLLFSERDKMLLIFLNLQF